MVKPGAAVRTTLTAVLFGILGFIGNWFKVPLFLDIDFLFGSFFVMLAVLRLGPASGIIASVIASSCTFLLWKHPWAMIIFIAETAFVGWQMRRRDSADILVCDIVYWFVCGWPLAWGVYHFVLGDSVSVTALIMLKQFLNGIFNTLLASLVHLAWQARSADRSELPSFRQLAFTTMVSLILFPALVHIGVDLRTMMRRESDVLADKTSHISEQARNSVLLWLTERHHPVQSAGNVDLDEGKELLKGFVGGRPMAVTLVDSLGQVIVSSRDDLATMSRFARPVGWTGQQVTGEVSHWVPPTEKGKNIMSRWGGALYVRELALSPDVPWKIVAESSFRPLLDSLTAATILSLAQLATLILVIVPLSHLACRRLVAALGQLQTATESFPQRLVTRTDLPLPTSTIREVDGLVQNFRLMATSLAHHIDDLKQLNNSLEERVALRTRELDETLTASVRKTAKIEALLAAITDCVAIIDREYVILYQNRTGAEKFGDCTGTRCHAAYAGNEAVCADCSVREVFRDGQVHHSRRSRMVNGSVRHLDVCASPLKDETGAIVAAVEVLRDVTDEVLAQEALREKERHLQTIIDASPECIKLLEHDGSLIMMNRSGLAMIGADSLEQVRGKCVYGLVMAPYRRDFEALSETVFAGGAGTLEFELVGLKSGRIWLETHAVPFRNERDEIVALLGIARDITARKRHEQELQEARSAAETASLAKSRFLANMSHELRTPMTGTLGMIELVLAEELPPRQRNNLEMGYKSATSLLRLLNDILDFARIEAGKVSFEEAPFLLEWCAKSALELFTLEAGRKGLTLDLEIEPGTPGMVTGDEGRVRQVLVNLVGNAVKFTEQGSVTVRLAAGAGEGGGRREVVFTVADTGIGVPRDKQTAIFNPFSQVDASRSRPYGGAGLGLAICNEVVRQMGGTLACSGEPGAGSAFTFTIPFRSAGTTVIGESVAEQEPPPPAIPHAGSCRILIAEDDPTNGQLIETIVRGKGFECAIARNGREAVEMWQQGEYSLILMDVQMPQLDGIDATRLIREQERTEGGHIPIIAVTAHAFSMDRENCLACGMDAYLAKPLDVKKLYHTLAAFTRPQGEYA